MDILRVCPRLVPTNGKRTCYDGYITGGGSDFRIRIQLRKPDELNGASLSCEWRLHHVLREHVPLVHKRLQQSASLAQFLIELKSIIERQLEKSSVALSSEVAPAPPTFYQSLIEQIETIGWERLVYIDQNFQELHLCAEDSACRRHVLRVHLHPTHPAVAPECRADLPGGEFRPAWGAHHTTLQALLQQFTASLERFQDLWEQLDELDSQTWILEPEKPNRAAIYRRIALGSQASLSVTFDPDHPRLLPDCRFLGAEHAVSPLRENLQRNLALWDPRRSQLSNLQSVLETTFPSPSNSSKEDFSLECGICYAYRLNGCAPERSCEDTRCGRPFHTACLYEWLRGLPTSRSSFNVVFGECPYCGKPITVNMPAT